MTLRRSKEEIELARKLKVHKNFIKMVAEFVRKTTLGCGDLVKTSTHSSHTHTVHELVFDEFRFRYDDGQTMFGGTDVVVYHENLVVFHLHFQSSIEEDGNIRAFDTSPAWQTKLKKLTALKLNQFAVRAKAGRLRMEREAVRQAAEQERIAKLKREADRFGLK